MRRKKAIICGVYGGDNRKYDSYILGYKTINIPCFKHKKKPISIIKVLEVRDKMNRKTLYLSEVGTGDIGLLSNHPLPEG